MTTFISAFLTAIMLMSGIGSGSVTIENIAVTVNDETYALDPAFTAAYTVEEGKATGAVYVSADGEQLFKTVASIAEDGISFAACDSEVFTLTGEFIENVAKANQINLEQFTESMNRFAGFGADTIKSKREYSEAIFKEWSATLNSEPVTSVVDGEEVTLNHVYGTIDNDQLLFTIDTLYRELMGDEAYTVFVQTMGSTQAEGEYNELSDYYKAAGMEFSLDMDAVVNDDLYGVWDMTMNITMPKTEEKDGVGINVVIHSVTVDADHMNCEARIDPTEEMPMELVFVFAADGKDFNMDYRMNVDDEDAKIAMVMNITETDGACSWSFNAGTDTEMVAAAYESGKGFEASVTEYGKVTAGVKFDVTFGSEGAELNADDATVIAADEDIEKININSVLGSYMSDVAKLMNNESVAAFVAAIAPADEAETAVE